LSLLADTLLSNVSPATANMLSYLMLVVVAVFLISGPTVYYIFSRKGRRAKQAEPTPGS